MIRFLPDPIDVGIFYESDEVLNFYGIVTTQTRIWANCDLSGELDRCIEYVKSRKRK